MRVLVAHNRYRSTSPGGEDRVVDQERAALVARGHTVEQFERFNDDIEEWSVARRAAVPAQVVWSRSARRSLSHVIREFRPDVVHVHNTFPLLSPSVLYACRAAAVPAVVTLHNYRLTCATGDLFRDGSLCHECVGRRFPTAALRHGCYQGSTIKTVPIAIASATHLRAWRTLPAAYLFISNRQREILDSLQLPRDRIFVKPNLVPAGVVPSTRVERSHIVVYAGRLAAAKGVPLLMDAWDRYEATGGGNLRLVIAGAGPLADAVAKWAAGKSSVEVRGMLSRDDCAALVARARAAIVPSAWEEAFGLVAVEAMACGVAPVAPAHGSFPELLEDGRDGVLFEPGNASALASVLHDIDTNPQRYDAYGKAARERYEKHFDPDANVDQLLDTYRFAIANPARIATDAPADEREIRDFWDAHPCGQDQVGAPDTYRRGDREHFFDEYDRFKFSIETHIPDCLDRLDLADKQVLEVGTGEGAESEQLIRRGARWSGIDLTPESIERVGVRLALRDLPFDDLLQASVLDLPFADESFDMVFSHGVLHHVPDVHTAQREIHRVLRPDGELVVMLSARWSLNYLVAIGAIRRAMLLAAYPLVQARLLEPSAMLDAHVRNARQVGLGRYLRMKQFIHSNTDGPGNPYSRVYDRRRLEADFPDFEVKKLYRRFMHAPPLPVHGIRGGRRAGWHLWAHLKPRA